MPRASATSAPIRLGTISLAAVEVVRSLGTGQGAVGGAVMIVSVGAEVWAGQNPVPVTPLTGTACRTTLPTRAVIVATSSFGAVTAFSADSSVSMEPICVPSSSTIQPALIVLPCTTAVAWYRPEDLFTDLFTDFTEKL